ncbi:MULTISPECIES: GAF domain-containing protein [unclassified Nocardia]|uniref:GAF domain-containing protein n=1 Tax=unclassified Nocardia TaxID=2637762 RepID=UPI001CE3DCFB|nr:MULTISPECIES: GAF domain-containing protein [unclassified Nocardia]
MPTGGHNEYLFETMGSEPRLIADGGRARDFRKVSSIFRGAERTLMNGLLAEVVATGETVVRTGRTADDEPRTITGFPVIGPDNNVAGVRVAAGADTVAPVHHRTTVAYQWELGIPNGPPRLHMPQQLVDLLEITETHRDRVVFGPLDFFIRVARTPQLVRMWESIVDAQPGYVDSGTLLMQTGDGRPWALLYAQRYVTTEVGPRLRVLCQDVTDIMDTREMRREIMDVNLAHAAIESSGQFGNIWDWRWPVTCILKWIPGFPPGLGHGASSGQRPGLHPDDIARMPEIRARAFAEGHVRERVRARRLAGGWMSGTFTWRPIDPEVSKTIGFALVKFDEPDSE